eukprot:TRINITY_DN6234_c0_g1_i2.p1 TRINITY_DN6234_c0_g1~~TRINITY_DN6234_c0_g1_i2.p1  ORF type:complete len:1050 (+),score=201.27 TRINITY_DN6234_c0_g1_i2:167-3316(+)
MGRKDDDFELCQSDLSGSVASGGNIRYDADDENTLIVKGTTTKGVSLFGENANKGLPSNHLKTSKYEWYNFLPLNLWLQMNKVANMYFFMNMVFSLIPGVSPVFPVTTIIPFVAVIGVASIRDAYEDWKRHKEDNKANSKKVQVLRYRNSPPNNWTSIKTRDIRAGDLIEIRDGDTIPADVLILSTSRDDSSAYVETANLDGEGNLKKKLPVSSTSGFSDPSTLQSLAFSVKCNAPSQKLDSWEGVLTWPEATSSSPCHIDNLMLRGCILRQTPSVVAMAVYTGVSTKMYLNLTPPVHKKSRIDDKLSRLILYILLAQQLIISILCGGSVYFARSSKNAHAFYLEYLNFEYGPAEYFIRHYFTYFVLLSLMMPISLFLSIEFCKALQAQFMEWDLFMYDEERDLTCKAKTASLNEELSQVQVICTDKTGTLTENKMVFATCFCGSKIYNELKYPGCLKTALAQESDPKLGFLMEILAVCNTVMPSHEGGNHVASNMKNSYLDTEYDYAGDSTDEVALARAARDAGIVLQHRSETEAVVASNKNPGGQKIKVLHTLPFSSDRKMMSVIIEHPAFGHQRLLFTKGSDQAIFSNLSNSDENRSLKNDVHRVADAFASDGLRTLCMGYKHITDHEYNSWLPKWTAATNSVTNRAARVEQASLSIEHSLTLVGATGIEDRLQPEVPETINYFRTAGVTIFILTGDKRETAINIATTCRLINSDTQLIKLDVTAGNLKNQMKSAREITQQRGNGSILGNDNDCGNCLVVDGKTYAAVTSSNDELLKSDFNELVLKVDAAICCRVTPLQKSDLVGILQNAKLTVLSVGDGANDVSMIQRAKVGVGIMGLEGSQAERSSDFAIPLFRHLQPLLAVHGRFALLKNSYLIQYSFYKNLIYSVCQILYSTTSGYTGQTLFDSWVIICYNMMFTLFPPLVMGLFEYDVRPTEVLQYPSLYYDLRSPAGGRLSRLSILRWFCWTIIHTAVIFGLILPSMQRDDTAGFRSSGIFTHGTYVMSAVICVVLAKASLTFMSWTWIHLVSIIISFVGYFGMLLASLF